ncbi:MAG: hypothetical protein R2762_30615 [Bryobacteraceae bacterium]
MDAEEKAADGEGDHLASYVTGHPAVSSGDKVRDLATHDSSTLKGLGAGLR